MGFLWESKKEKELREEKALEAILKAFDTTTANTSTTIDNKEKKENIINDDKNTSIEKKDDSVKKDIDLNDLVEFLCTQKIISKLEWEKFTQDLYKK